MLKAFKLSRYPFEFNGKKFYSFDKKFIPLLLGKRGNQVPINTAGSAWKKQIHRNVNLKQAESDYINPKWQELFDFLQSHLITKNAIFVPEPSLSISEELDDLCLSTKTNDKKRLGEFLRFREIQINNLVYFKDEPKFRKKVLQLIYDKDQDFKRSITPQYIYILLTLYIAKQYSIFNNYEYKEFANKTGLSYDEYKKKFYDVLKSDSRIENFNALCYTQYFWLDYRLSGSDHSEIHKILYNMFHELNIPNEDFT